MSLSVFALGIVGVSFLWGVSVGLVSAFLQKSRGGAPADGRRRAF